MKIKKVFGLLGLILCLSSCSGLEGFLNNFSNHTHTYNNTYEYDDSYHWKDATCEHKSEKKDYNLHDFVEVFPVANSYNKYEQCTVCEYLKTTNDFYKPTVDTTKVTGQTYTLHIASDDKTNNDTFIKDGITLDYHNNSSVVNNHTLLSKNGYIVNSTPLNDIVSFSVNYEAYEDSEYGWGEGLYYVCDNYYISDPFSYKKTLINSEQVITISEDYSYICFFTYTKCLIKTIDITFTWGDSNVANAPKTITLFGTNDVHGSVNKTSSTSGLVEASQYIENIKNTSKYNILLDQGDIYQGSSASYYTNGRVMNDYLMSNGYSAVSVGNHEWDNGVEKLNDYYDYLDTPVLANNIRYKDTKQSPLWARNYVLVERGGVKIGIIGSIGDVSDSISSSQVSNIDFISGDELTNQIKKDSNTLKSLGANFIILSTHDGGSNSISGSYDISLSKEGYVDLVLEGHSHSKYALKDAYGVYHIQNYGYMESIYSVQLNADVNNNVSVGNISFTTTYELNNLSIKNDNLMNKINTWFNNNVYGMINNRVITTISENMSGTTIYPLIAEALYDLRSLVKGYNVILGGGFMKLRTPYYLYSGDVTYGDIANLIPFDNNLQLCSISGSNLKNFIRRTNYYVYPSISAASISSYNTYYIITDSYSSDYAYNNLTVIKDLTKDSNLSTYGKFERDIFSDKLKECIEGSKTDTSTIKFTHQLTCQDFIEGGTSTNSSATYNANTVNFTLYHSPIIDNSYYNEFNLPDDGYLTINIQDNYIISSIEIQTYSYYTNEIEISVNSSSVNVTNDSRTPRSTYKANINSNSLTINNIGYGELDIISIKLYVK